MDYTQLIIKELKPKVASIGFSKDEVKSIAAIVADNLNLTEEATEEEVNSAISDGVTSILPLLKVSQQMTTRIVNLSKKSEVKEEEKTVEKSEGGKDNNEAVSESNEEPPAWAKALIEQNKKVQEELNAMKAGKVLDTRRAKLEKLLKDTGVYGKRTLKNFSRMSFENDDAFNDFYADVEEGLQEYNQERANEGLAKLGAPVTGSKSNESKKQEVLSEKEVEALAETM